MWPFNKWRKKKLQDAAEESLSKFCEEKTTPPKESIHDWTVRRVKELESEETPAYNNWKGNKYAERLIKEWTAYKRIVLGVDFDDTVYPWGFKGFEANVKFKEVIDTIKRAQKIGAYISVWSACAPERYDEIRNYFRSFGVEVDSINENPIPLPYGNNRKMYYNWLLDDRAGLEQALAILDYACMRMHAVLNPIGEQNVEF